MKKKTKKRHIKLGDIFMIIIALWLCINYCEILAKNVRPNPEYSKYNIIVNYIKYIDNLNVGE